MQMPWLRICKAAKSARASIPYEHPPKMRKMHAVIDVSGSHEWCNNNIYMCKLLLTLSFPGFLHSETRCYVQSAATCNSMKQRCRSSTAFCICWLSISLRQHDRAAVIPAFSHYCQLCPGHWWCQVLECLLWLLLLLLLLLL